MRMRKKKNLQPRMERCESCWVREPKNFRGAWHNLMPQATAIHLELGCGKGRFTCEMAAKHPDTLFLAVERVPDAMIIAMEQAMSEGISNVFFIDGDAKHLSEYFSKGEIDRIYINFCDPWPGHRHARRRLTHEGFLKSYRSVLKETGEIHFKTDNRDLFDYSLFQFPKAGYEVREITRNLHENGVVGVMTDYEEKFHAQRMPIHRCVGRITDLSLMQAMEENKPESKE